MASMPHNRTGQSWAPKRTAAGPGGRGMAMPSCATAKARHRLSTSSTRSDVWRKRTSKAVLLHCPHETPAENDRELPSMSSQWPEGSAVGTKQRVRGISGLPCPSQGQGNRYCDVLKASQSVSLSVAHFAPQRAKCAFDKPIRMPDSMTETPTINMNSTKEAQTWQSAADLASTA